MKGLYPDKTVIEKHQEVDQQKEYTLAYSLKKPGKNMILWEYDTVNEVLKKADLTQSIRLNSSMKTVKDNRVETESKSLYLFALNKKNALKKLRKVGIIA